MEVQDDGFKGYALGDATEGLADLALQRMMAREKTKRLLIGSVTLLILASMVATLFAPAGRETTGYVIGATLLVLALGAVGSSNFILKVGGVVDLRAAGAGESIARQGRERFSGTPTPKA